MGLGECVCLCWCVEGLGWAGPQETMILVCPHDSPTLSGWDVIGMAGTATKLPSLCVSQRIMRRTKNDVGEESFNANRAFPIPAHPIEAEPGVVSYKDVFLS